MDITPAIINSYIRSRNTTTPDFFSGKPVPRAVIEELLENATWAPSHKLTQPWRFKVFRKAALERLGNYLAEAYKKEIPPESFSEVKYRKTREKSLRSGCVIIIIMKRSEEGKIPEWEEIAAMGAAIENIWLSLAAYGLGGYWSTPAGIINAREFLGLQPDERCLGLFYLGYSSHAATSRKRHPVVDKAEWVEE